MEREGSVKHLRVDSLQVAEPHYFDNRWRLRAGDRDFDEIMPRMKGASDLE